MTSRVVAFAAFGALLGALGCSGSSAPVSGNPTYDDAGCRIGCSKCPGNSWCVSTPYQPACLAPCSEPGVCPGGICAILDSPDLDSEPAQPLCLMARSLTQCRPVACAIVPRCRDAQTLMRPLAFKDQICGWELVRCETGCDSATAQCK
jgi:hypothetical protein